MKHPRRWIAASAVVVLGLAAGGAGVASATGGDDHAPAITGTALDRARAAALAHTDGRVTGTEVNDEESYYEVEVTRPDGRQVDVQLDRSFHVVGAQADHEDGR
jgi:hypothetical protein